MRSFFPSRAAESAALALLMLFVCVGNSSAQIADSFQAHGYLTGVDPFHSKLVLLAGGVTYVVDTRQASIHLLTQSQPAETGDLVTGMRVEVGGDLLTGKIVRADSVKVLPYVPPTPPTLGPMPVTVRAGDTLKILGSVAAVDIDTGVLVVKSGEDTRIVRVSSLTIIQTAAGHEIKLTDVADSDKIRLTGVVSADGSVRASQFYDLTAPDELETVQPVAPKELSLHGTVSETATFFSRNIKVSINGSDVSVTVPRGITIEELDGTPISVHDLTKGTSVKISGLQDPSGSVTAGEIVADDSGNIGQ